jgi:polysaccharide biosynthesis transport protein
MSNHDQLPMAGQQYSQSVPSANIPLPAFYDSEEQQGIDLWEYLSILLKRKWWILGTFLIIFIGVTVYTLTRTPIFRATGMLQITRDNPASQVGPDDKISQIFSTDSEKFQLTQYKILQSESIAQRVIQALNLKDHPDFEDIWKDPKQSKTEIDNAMVARFLSKLEINPVKNTFLVEVAFKSPDKVMAQKVVNAMADQYMYLSIDRRNESFTLVRNWLDKQLQEMETKVQKAQKKLFKFAQKTDIYTLEDKDNVVVQKFIDLSGLLTKAQAEKIGKEAQFQQIKEKGPNAPLIVNHGLVAALRQQLVAQQAKVSALKKVFRSGHPELQGEEANLAELQGRLNAEIKRLQESIKADYEAAMRTEKFLSDSLSKQKGQMVKLQDHLSDFQILKRDAHANEVIYEGLLARIKETNIAGSMVASNVAIIDPSRVPDSPYLPKTSRNLIAGAFLGLTLGVGMALLLEYLDDSIKTPDDVERACQLPSLGFLPILENKGQLTLSRQKKSGESFIWRYLPHVKRVQPDNAEESDIGLIVYKHPMSQVSEGIHHIYSSLMLSASGRPPDVIMVTSPNPSEGKTMLSSNLALCYALNERSVVVIDCDLRRPQIHRVFQVESKPGLSNYLTGSATLEEILRPTLIPNLTVIAAGARPPSPANLLNSENFKDLITTLRQKFRHIVIDTPPVLHFADARFISTLADGVLLVTKYQSTRKSAGRLAHQLLSQANVLGVVLNSVGVYGQTYGSYYYYYYNRYYSRYTDLPRGS